MTAKTMTLQEANAIAQRRIEALEAENQKLLQMTREAEQLFWELAEVRAERDALREAAQTVIDSLRGSGGLDPQGAEALRKLQILLEEEG